MRAIFNTSDNIQINGDNIRLSWTIFHPLTVNYQAENAQYQAPISITLSPVAGKIIFNPVRGTRTLILTAQKTQLTNNLIREITDLNMTIAKTTKTLDSNKKIGATFAVNTNQVKFTTFNDTNIQGISKAKITGKIMGDLFNTNCVIWQKMGGYADFEKIDIKIANGFINGFGDLKYNEKLLFDGKFNLNINGYSEILTTLGSNNIIKKEALPYLKAGLSFFANSNNKNSIAIKLNILDNRIYLNNQPL